MSLSRFDLQALAARVHLANKKWWRHLDTGAPLLRNPGELLMLVVSELSESLEGHRKNLADDKLPTRRMAEVEIADAIIRVLDIIGGWGLNVENVALDDMMPFSDNYAENLMRLTVRVTHCYTERADAPLMDRSFNLSVLLHELIRFSVAYDMDWLGAFEEKMTYNAVRVDHTNEHRKSEHGKKY